MPIDANWPPASGDIPSATGRSNFQAIKARIDTLPETWASYQPGELLAVNDAGTGPTPASGGTEEITARGRALMGFTPREIAVGSNTSLRHDEHLNALLMVTSSGGIVLQLERNANPAAGVLGRFSCSIVRPSNAGSVQVTSSNMTNDTADGHSKVAASGCATLYVDAAAARWWLWGMTEA